MATYQEAMSVAGEGAASGDRSWWEMRKSEWDRRIAAVVSANSKVAETTAASVEAVGALGSALSEMQRLAVGAERGPGVAQQPWLALHESQWDQQTAVVMAAATKVAETRAASDEALGVLGRALAEMQAIQGAERPASETASR